MRTDSVFLKVGVVMVKLTAQMGRMKKSAKIVSFRKIFQNINKLIETFYTISG